MSPQDIQETTAERAWAPYEPSDDRPWTRSRAAHLLRRAGFGPSREELRRAVEDGPEATVERLLNPGDDVVAFDAMHDDLDRASHNEADGLRAWWLRRMIDTPHMLQEKMTLFWHGRFVASIARTDDAGMMHDYVRILRREALGDFRTLLQSLAVDAAFLVSRGGEEHRKSRPNVRYAGALLEETVGEGAFTQDDVTDLARATTGYFVQQKRRRFTEREFDDGQKTILGRSGAFDAAGAVDVLVDHSATSRNIVRDLVRYLVSETMTPPDDFLAPLAESFAEDQNIAALVGRILRSNVFYSDEANRQRVKSPVEFAVGAVRALEGRVNTQPLSHDLAALGQELLRPPTLAGWPGGVHWLNATSMLARSNAALALVSPEGRYGAAIDPAAFVEKAGASDVESGAKLLLDVLLQGDVDDASTSAIRDMVEAADGDDSKRIRQVAHALLALPEYQLA